MAAKNAKPANSSDSENEWTFIDSYDGTIETRKDCVTYRKPTYSEILKGVTDDELAEVESEPEFEVLASFQFRSKGESFGIGSSAPQKNKTSVLSETSSKKETKANANDGSSSDDGIMIVRGHYELAPPVIGTKNRADETVADSDGCDGNDELNLATPSTECSSSNNEVNDAIVVVGEGCMYDFDDEDDDEMIDLGDSVFDGKSTRSEDDDDDKENHASDDDDSKSIEVGPVLNLSFMNSTLNKILIDDEKVEPEEDEHVTLNTPFMDTSLNRILIDEDVELLQPEIKSDAKPESCTNSNGKLLILDPVDSSRDLAWDSLTFDLMNAQPIIMASTTSLSDTQSDLFQDNNDSDCDILSDSSFVPIMSHTNSDESSFDNLSDLSDCSYDSDETLMIPGWLYDPNFQIIGLDESHDDNICEDIEDNEPNDPLIPEWFYDADHDIYDFDQSFDEWEYSDYTDSDSEYDSNSDEDSVVAIPEWLFGGKHHRRNKDDEESFLFSQLFVDVPTFVILLFLTTALGFSIGHGLTVYLNGQANTKLEETPTHSNSYQSHLEQRLLTPEEIAKIDLLKLEDEIYRQKDSELLSSHLRDDLRNLHQNLQKKHSRLLHNHKSTEDRLHITKSMSWFWRNKYDQEKRQNQNSSAVTYLQRQLERVAALYDKERKVADRWRRFRKARFPLSPKQSEQLKNDSQKGREHDLKASLASKYWAQAILQSRGIDWEGFRKRWTEDLMKSKQSSCRLKQRFISRDVLGLRRSKKLCKKSQGLGSQNATLKQNKKVISQVHEKRSKLANEKQNKAVVPQGPPRRVWFGMMKKKYKRKKGETARRPVKDILKERLKKRAARVKALEIERQTRELKEILVELRNERRKAKSEKFKLESSWRTLKRQRKLFEKEKQKKRKSENKLVEIMKSKLTRTRTKLKTWKNVAFVFQKQATALQRNMKRISRSQRGVKDIKKIKRELKIEKRKIKKQNQDLKTLKTQLRREYRHYAREGWKMERKRKFLEQNQSPPKKLKKSPIKCPKQAKPKRKRNKVVRKNAKEFQTSPKRKKPHRNKKGRLKHQKQYWKNLEDALRKWTRNLNNTVKENATGKIKQFWEKLQEKFGKLMGFGWTKKKKAKPPFSVKKKKKTGKDSESKASLIYQNVLAEQLKFEKQKRKESDNSRKPLKSKSPISPTRKRREKKDTDPDNRLKQRRRRQRRKLQRELERLHQWALQMNEKKLEHDRIYKDKRKPRTKCTKFRLKSKSDEKEIDKCEDESPNHRELDSDSVDDTSNLTNTLMLLVQPQFAEPQYNYPEKLYSDSKDPSQNTERMVRDVLIEKLNYKRTTQPNTELSIPVNDEDLILPPKNTQPEHKIPYQENEEQMSNKPTPPIPDPTLYNQLPLLGVLESEKSGSMGLPIAPPSLDPIDSHGSVKGPNLLGSRVWYKSKTPQAWIPPPSGPLQSEKPCFYQTSLCHGEQRKSHGPFNKEHFEKKDSVWVFDRARDRSLQRAQDKENSNEQNSFQTQFINTNNRAVKKNGIWVFARASDRAEQRLLYEPLNRRKPKGKPVSPSSQSKTPPTESPEMRNSDGTWNSERASGPAEQRSNEDSWYMRRTKGRQEDHKQREDTWFIERGFDREILRQEDAHHMDDDDDDDDDDYDIDFGNYDDVDDDISAP